jgi:beta-aspartyl-peptidase (threonine type)
VASHRLPGAGPAVVVHGGAWDIPDEALQAHREGLRRAVGVGRRLVERGTRALDVATEAVAVLEGHGAFDAGCGAMLNQDGEAELDAGLMDGASGDYGSVMAVRRLPEPVRVARRLLDAGKGRVRMLAATGAERFAEAQGMPLVDNDALVSARERRRYERLRSEAEARHPSASFLPGASGERLGDTVGCVVRDADGHLAAATSTGGTPFKPPGRVGDSPLPGAGFYASPRAAAGATGWGEAIAGVVLSREAVAAVESGTDVETAARHGLAAMHERVASPDGKGATGGLILADAAGRAAWAHTTPRMAAAGWSADAGAPWVEIGERSAG